MASIRPIAPNPTNRFLTRVLVLIAVLVGLGIIAGSCVARVDAAHVGIRVKLAGSSRGVDDIPVVTGWVFYNPLTEQLVMFPTSVQTVVWTQDSHEGNAHDESITFSSQEGVNINADIGLSFLIEPSMAPHLYLKFRKANLLELANGYIRNGVRDAFNVVASTMPVQGIYGSEKGKLVSNVATRLRDQLGKEGIIIDQLTINGALRLPENVATAINRAMEATQLAIQAENKVRQFRAEAEQTVTQAEGLAAATRARARGEADAKLIVARAETKANLILRASMTASVLQYRALEKWNGKLPIMNGGTLPLLTIDASKLGKADTDEKLLKELLAEEEADAHGKASVAETDKKADTEKSDSPTKDPEKK